MGKKCSIMGAQDLGAPVHVRGIWVAGLLSWFLFSDTNLLGTMQGLDVQKKMRKSTV
jgi:hypothetical protein